MFAGSGQVSIRLETAASLGANVPLEPAEGVPEPEGVSVKTRRDREREAPRGRGDIAYSGGVGHPIYTHPQPPVLTLCL